MLACIRRWDHSCLQFVDKCRVGSVLGYREDILGHKVYIPESGYIIYGDQITANEGVTYKDRRGPYFEEYICDWAVDQFPDLTSVGRQDYDLLAVGCDKVSNADDEVNTDDNADKDFYGLSAVRKH